MTSSGRRSDYLAYWSALILVGASIVFGGGARWNKLEWMLAAAAFVVAMVALCRAQWTQQATQVVAWIGLASLLVILHLVPLPPEIWLSSGSRAELAATIHELDIKVGWHPWTLDPQLGWQRAASLFLPFALALVAIVGGRHFCWRLLGVVAAAGAAQAFIAFAQSMPGPLSGWSLHPYPVRAGATGTFASPNMLACALVMSLPAVVTMAKYASLHRVWGLPAWVWWGGVVCQLLALLLTQSRAGIAIALLCCSWLLLMMNRGWDHRRATVFMYAGFTLVLVGGAMVLIDRSVLSIVGEQSAMGGRLGILRGIPAMSPSPGILGYGIGAFPAAYRSSPGNMITDAHVHHAHNDWLEVVLETGLPGALLLLYGVYIIASMASITLRRGIDPAHRVGRAAMVGVVAAMLHSLVDYPLRSTANAAVFMLLVAIMVSSISGLGSTSKQKRQEET